MRILKTLALSMAIVSGVYAQTAHISENPAVKVHDMRGALQEVPLNFNRSIFNRIVGGQDAEKGEYPFIVALIQKGQPTENGQFCGGSLIDKKWILTAAHCVVRDFWGQTYVIKPETVDILVGGYDLKDSSTGRRIAAKQIIKHESYDTNTMDNDIALIELSEEVKDIAPVKIIKAGNGLDEVGVDATVIGWGNIRGSAEEGFERPDVLQEVNLPMVSQEVCDAALQEVIAGQGYDLHISGNMLCAGFEEGGKDSCQGDSGGPLVVKTGDAHTQTGVVSWGIGCAQPKAYGVYTKLQNYLGWIKKLIK